MSRRSKNRLKEMQDLLQKRADDPQTWLDNYSMQFNRILLGEIQLLDERLDLIGGIDAADKPEDN